MVGEGRPFGAMPERWMVGSGWTNRRESAGHSSGEPLRRDIPVRSRPERGLHVTGTLVRSTVATVGLGIPWSKAGHNNGRRRASGWYARHARAVVPVGSVVVSVDAELGWGFHDQVEPPPHRVESGRPGWIALLEQFDEYDVPATWAVVAHLVLDSCDGRHDDHPSPDGWFDRERGEWRDRPDLRFDRALVERIVDAGADHELASHSFSHVLFEDPAVDREIAVAEAHRSRELLGEIDRPPTTFVFPRNEVKHRSVLAECGYECYRGRNPFPEGFAGVVDGLVFGEDALVRPSVDEYGLVNLPPSLFLFDFEGTSRTVVESIWADPVVERVRRGVDAAAKSDAVFHVWLHPNNVSEARDVDRIRAVLEYVDRVRSDTDLRVETMRTVADRARRGDVSSDECPIDRTA